MAPFDGAILDIVYAFLILVPGFLSYRIGRYVGKVTVTVDRFNKSAYTLIASGFSFSILVIGYTVITDNPLSSVIQADYTISELGVAYLVLLSIASLNGLIAGLIIDRRLKAGIKTRRDKTWEITFGNAEHPIEARVITTMGDEIHGYIEVFDSQEHGKDLLLKYPQRIIKKEGHVVEEISLGEYVFVNEHDLSHVYFESDIEVE